MAIIGLIALLWTSLLLTASYFVLLTLSRAEKGLKTFGKLVVAVLLIAALVIAATGVYVVVTGTCPMMGIMQEHCKMMKLGGMKGGPCGSMMEHRSTSETANN